MKFFKNRRDNSVRNRRIKVLVIEDDPSLIEVLEDLFEISDFDFNVYQDVQDIKALVYLHQPDVVLLDYLLPSSNGGNLCQQLKRDKRTAETPVIIYSAISKQLLPVNEYQCDFFIEKPFDLDVLIHKIKLCYNKQLKQKQFSLGTYILHRYFVMVKDLTKRPEKSFRTQS